MEQNKKWKNKRINQLMKKYYVKDNNLLYSRKNALI